MTGRFAPSPTGPLHLGSLLAATASWVDVRHRGGRWLLRIEDIDPPREQPGAADAILRSLDRHGLTWDGPVLWQHDRHAAYDAALKSLQTRGLVYACRCSRSALAAAGVPDCLGPCRTAGHASGAWRLSVQDAPLMHWQDALHGPQCDDLRQQCGDFVLMRRDGLPAYQLAVVVDDAASAVTTVARGADLFDNTARQCWLQQQLGLPRPEYLHLPLLLMPDGRKLSKQNHAPALTPAASANLCQVLHWLGQAPPPDLHQSTPAEVLDWACTHWSRARIPRQAIALPA